MAFDTALVVGDAVGLHAGVAGAAGLGLLHVRHGIAGRFAEIENCVVAYLAIVVIFCKVQFVTEDYRLRVFELVPDVFGLRSQKSNRRATDDEKGQDGKAKLHDTLLLTTGIFTLPNRAK